jgi:hypothetical protein
MAYKIGIGIAALVAAMAVGWGTWTLSGTAQPPATVTHAAAPSAPAPAQPASAAADVAAPAVASASGPVTSEPVSPRPVPPIAEGLDLVPAETLMCWYGRPFPDTAQAADAPNFMQFLMQLVPLALNNEARLWARGLEAFNLAIRYPHVVALVDARAIFDESKSPPIPRGDRIRFALIVQTDGQDEPFARVIQAAINEQTDRDNSKLSRQQAGNWPYMELRDQRLPDWCTIAWGNIGSFFVFTIGPDVWPDIAAVAGGQKEALSHTEWLENARDERARHALIEIIVRSQDIRERLDPFVDGRATAFFSAWQAEGIERSHWALGFEGRAMYCIANVIENGQPRQRLLADPNIKNPDLLATIPDTARYAIYHISPADTLPRFFNALLATRTARERQNVHRLWKQIQEERGFDADRDILAHMGEYIVMHNDPPHPFRIPLAMTTLTPIREEPQQVSRAVDALSEAWRDAQQKFRETTGDGPNNMLIDRDNDGIWYVKFGLGFAGPAWIVTDRFLITSWSPSALRSYLEKVGDRAGRPLTP